MKDIILIGTGMVGKSTCSLPDAVTVVNEQHKQTIKDIETFIIKPYHYAFNDGLGKRDKKPKNKEWQKRIKNLQNLRK